MQRIGLLTRLREYSAVASGGQKKLVTCGLIMLRGAGHDASPSFADAVIETTRGFNEVQAWAQEPRTARNTTAMRRSRCGPAMRRLALTTDKPAISTGSPPFCDRQWLFQC